MSLADLYESKPKADATLQELFPARSQVIDTLSARRYWDILVIGGGIHGAMFARLSALHGLRTVLLERFDYAWATSSRTSKMAHGGLRYLENFDLRQVWEGVRSREDLLNTAPHLVKAQDFMIPLTEQQTFFRWKLKLGLIYYDLLLGDKKRKHSWLDKSKLPEALEELDHARIKGAYLFSDALMDDKRLVLENIVAARQEGAECLNHARVLAINQREDGTTLVGWSDELSGKTYEIQTGTVVNCAGPWAPQIGRLSKSHASAEVRYSRGIHLIFSNPYSGPALLRYARRSGSHYFIWPHQVGALVGPTDQEVQELQQDPEPEAFEISALLDRLEQDFPRLGLKRDKLHYCYAGLRTLPARGRASTGQLSRRHVWNYSRGMLSLLGGKFTTAGWTVYEGFQLLCKMAEVKLHFSSLKGRNLPGAPQASKALLQEFESECQKKAIPKFMVEQAYRRFGARLHLLKEPLDFEQVNATLLRGELRMAVEVEQAETVQDLVERRLNLHLTSDYGFSALETASRMLRHLSEEERLKQLSEYIKKINCLRAKMGLPEFKP